MRMLAATGVSTVAESARVSTMEARVKTVNWGSEREVSSAQNASTGTWTPSCCGTGDCRDTGCCDAGCSGAPVPADAAEELHEALWIAPPTLDTVSVRSQQQKNDDRGRPKTGATCSLSDN